MLETNSQGMIPWSPLKYKSTYTGIVVCVCLERFLLKTPLRQSHGGSTVPWIPKFHQSLLMFLSSSCGSRSGRLSKLQFESGGRFSFFLLLSISQKHTRGTYVLCICIRLPLRSRPSTLKDSNRVLNIKTTEASLDVVSVARLCSKTLKSKICVYIYLSRRNALRDQSIKWIKRILRA